MESWGRLWVISFISQTKMSNTYTHPKRFIVALVFAGLFSVIGWAIPEIYYQYIDDTEYYVVKQPVPVNKDRYQPCEDISFIIDRVARKDITGSVKFELARIIDSDSVEKRELAIDNPATLTAGEQIVVITHQLPCDIELGDYYVIGLVEYDVRGHSRTYFWTSESFQVLN